LSGLFAGGGAQIVVVHKSTTTRVAAPRGNAPSPSRSVIAPVGSKQGMWINRKEENG
jgi:hypothetical protein